MSNVADVKSKTVKITLNDGVERELKFTLNALAELEEIYGSVQAAFDKLEKENSMKALRSVLWAGLIWKEPDLTEHEVGNLIDIAHMQELVDSLSETMETNLPDNKGAALELVSGESDPN